MLTTVAAGTGTGAVIDLSTSRVPNPLTIGLAACGVALAAGGVSGLSVGASLAGFARGLALMLPGYAIGATGAGDVKLFAAAGAFIGPAHILAAFLYTVLAGKFMNSASVGSVQGRHDLGEICLGEADVSCFFQHVKTSHSARDGMDRAQRRDRPSHG